MRAALSLGLALSLSAAAMGAGAQTPQPFPKVGAPKASAPAAQAPSQSPADPPRQAPAPGEVPNETTLGVQIYPGAEFLSSFDAGRGQRYYLFGTNAGFVETVTFYRTALKQRGELLFEEPAIHQFEIGRFKEETMAFPPSVTVKDYSWGGSAGYLNPHRGQQPARFKTIIQIVPAPPI